MKVPVLICFYIIIISLPCLSQDTLHGNTILRKIKTSDTLRHITVPGKIIDGDTLPSVDMYAITVYPEVKFPSSEEMMKYQKLVYRVRKVYPYAKLASNKLDEYRRILDTISTNKRKRQFIRKAQKELEAQFGEEIKNLSFSQGKILIKLIYRQTGSSTYDVVKELRGGFNAFFWQSAAGLFGYDLKTPYDPKNDEDQMIEKIIQLIDAGKL